jgi:hypothetical protein
MRAERYPQTFCATSNRPQASSEASSGGDYHRSIAATSLGVAGRMEGHANPFSKQTNCFSSPSARGTESLLDRRKPPRKCRLKECSPGETRYTLICLGEMAPTFEPSRKTLTPPLARLRRWARPRTSWDVARTTATVGNAGQTRLGARHSRMVAPSSSSIVLFYTDRRRTVRRGLPESVSRAPRIAALFNRDNHSVSAASPRFDKHVFLSNPLDDES